MHEKFLFVLFKTRKNSSAIFTSNHYDDFIGPISNHFVFCVV